MLTVSSNGRHKKGKKSPAVLNRTKGSLLKDNGMLKRKKSSGAHIFEAAGQSRTGFVGRLAVGGIIGQIMANKREKSEKASPGACER